MTDWTKVRAARKRGKQGRLQPGDQELCEAAWKSNPELYNKMSVEVIREVAYEERVWAGFITEEP